MVKKLKKDVVLKAKPSDMSRVGHSPIKEVTGDIINIFSKLTPGQWIVIPTNGEVKKSGEAVMGKGVAKQFASIWTGLPLELGKLLKRQEANRVYVFPDYGVFTFPTKDKWKDPSNTSIIRRSCTQLDIILNVMLMYYSDPPINILMPHVGCGEDELDWIRDVKPMIDFWFKVKSHLFTIVNYEYD